MINRLVTMIQFVGQPFHGWLPLRVGHRGVQFEFLASGVTGDVVRDLILASAWLAQIDRGLLTPAGARSSYTPHFWREPKWNSLAFDALPDSPGVSVAYFHEHESAMELSATADDLFLLSPDLVGRFHRIELAAEIGTAVRGMLRATSIHDYLEHWRRPLGNEFGILDEVLRSSGAVVE